MLPQREILCVRRVWEGKSKFVPALNLISDRELREGLVCSQGHGSNSVTFGWLTHSVSDVQHVLGCGGGRWFVYEWCFSSLPGVWRDLVASLIARVNIILVTCQLSCVPCVFFPRWILLELLYHPQFFVWQNFLKCNFIECIYFFVPLAVCFKYGWRTLKFFGVKVVRLYSKRVLVLLLDTQDMDTSYQGFPHCFNSCTRIKREFLITRICDNTNCSLQTAQTHRSNGIIPSIFPSRHFMGVSGQLHVPAALACGNSLGTNWSGSSVDSLVGRDSSSRRKMSSAGKPTMTPSVFWPTKC